MKEIFEQLVNYHHLSAEQVQSTIEHCVTGQLLDSEIAAFLALMRMKGETVEELTAAALMLKHHAKIIELGEDIIDIVGTGGDGANTFNISTVTSFVVASTGVKVAKHGNHSVSSRSGSADLLIKAGFNLDLTDEQIKASIEQFNMVFLFAPRFHHAMRHAKNARQALKIRTLFNLLGPLLNPASVKHQVIGVAEKKWQRPVAHILKNLGSHRALVIHSRDGLDEASIVAPTDVVELHNGVFKEWSIDPKSFGYQTNTLNDIVVSSPEESLKIAQAVLNGQKGPARNIVLLNAGLALYCAGRCDNVADGIQVCAEAMDSGHSLHCFEQLASFTKG